MWGTFLSNNKYFSCQPSCLLLLLEVCKNHYKKEINSVGGSEQRRGALFWIRLRETWLNLFRLLLVALIFSTFIFSIGIKLFIGHPVVLFSILILLEKFDDLCSFPHGVFLKTGNYVFIYTWNTEFYIPLSLRQNKSRYKIWHWLELVCSCKWKQSTNKEI